MRLVEKTRIYSKDRNEAIICLKEAAREFQDTLSDLGASGYSVILDERHEIAIVCGDVPDDVLIDLIDDDYEVMNAEPNPDPDPDLPFGPEDFNLNYLFEEYY